jgi:cysteinyl-tRNA synthetase
MDARPAGQAGVFFAVTFRRKAKARNRKCEKSKSMELRLYDTLTREKRIFTPLDPKRVRMYVCGPTVYDFAHIGNARPVIVFDVLFRLLRHLYGAEHVAYVRNITDVDDKINARAAQEYPGLALNEAIRQVTEKTDKQFHDDVAALGCLAPTVEPRATEHIAEMKTLIERLLASGNAYVAEEHVLFSVPSMKDYGKLSKRPLEEMIAGARVEVAPYKRNPMDFVLWKPSKPGEPAWASPGAIKTPGRPGWHIECSAMSWKHLGETFDIHGGGIDLVFPHHENEIAQSRCAFHTPVMANFWMHNGFLQVEGEKMAKSEGNFVTIRDLLKDWPGEVLRLAMLMTQYRQPIDWTVRRLQEAKSTLNNWYQFALPMSQGSAGQLSENTIDALYDDLNTPAAITELRRLGGIATGVVVAGEGHPDHIEVLDHEARVTAARQLISGARALGIMQQTKAEWEHWRPRNLAGKDEQIDALIKARLYARKEKNFKEADRIRDELAAMGVELEDHKDGTSTPKVKR